MSRKLVGYGVVALTLWAASGGAEAKLVRYEIDGKQYSYSTNNIQQTREARRRIEAANAAAAARSRAETERAASPMVGLFGSQAQREAAEAQSRLQQTLTGAEPTAGTAAGPAPETGADLESTSSVRKSRTAARRSGTAVSARLERRRAAREARAERRQTAAARMQKQAALSPPSRPVETRKAAPKPEEARKPAEPKSIAPKSAEPKSAEPKPALAGRRETVTEPPRIVSEPRSPAEPPKASLPENAAASLMDFVNQVRKAIP